MKRVSIFGATGSVGQNTINLLRSADPGAYQTVALTGAHNIAQLAEDAVALGAQIAVTSEPKHYEALCKALSGSKVKAAAGRDALIEAAQMPVDWAMSAIVGAAGLEPGYHILRQGACLALANKESMVAAGPLMRRMAQDTNVTLLPVDSEHSAVFQLIQNQSKAAIEKVTLTASGGAFRDLPADQLAHVTPQQAMAHPTWDMGQRITIDSASMFNKALEVIEARELFALDPDQIDVVIHPQSLVHALISFVDGGIFAHLGAHDMRHAIGYALYFPKRQSLPVPRLEIGQMGHLAFEPPDLRRYPALRLAQEVMQAGGHMGAAFNAAKEIALDAFIAHDIGFLDMAEIVERTMEQMHEATALSRDDMTLETVLRIDDMTRARARQILARSIA